MTTELLTSALSYVESGLCVLPAIAAEKRAALPRWKQYQNHRPSEVHVRSWFDGNADAMCLIAGKVSGNLELLDFDGAGEFFGAWRDRVDETAPGLFERLVIETSPSGGRHAVYRCDAEVCGNLKLAQRRINCDGPEPVELYGKRYTPRKDRDGHFVLLTFIETRGEGGLFLCAPSPGYQLTQGDLAKVPVITADEREILLAAAWSLNEHYAEPVGAKVHTGSANLTRPGDDFNQRGDVGALLEAHGWGLVKPGENEYWRRSGKDQGWSASLRDGVLYVFSSSASPFEPNQAYSPFATYALLEHNGDFQEAAKALRDLGYGDQDPTPGSSDVDLSAFGCPAPTPEPDEPDLPDPGPLPEELLSVPGFIDEVMAYTLANAPYPDRTLAFCGALALQATLAGRKVRDSAGARSSLYLLGLANSGVGKNYPREVNQRIMLAAGLPQQLADNFASGEGIEDRMLTTRTVMFQTDEIDAMLLGISKSRDGRAERIMEILLKFYTAAGSLYHARVKAGQEPQFIDQPCLVLYGTAIPKHYYESLCDKMLTNGFFARMLVFEAGKRGDGQEPGEPALPQSVIDTARWWANCTPGGGGNLDDEHPTPAIVPTTDEARSLLADVRRAEVAAYDVAQEADDPAAMAVWARAGEKTRRLALIHAVSQNHQHPEIGADAVRWAWAVVEHQTKRMLFQASQHVAENPFHAECLKLMRKLREAPNQTMPHSVLLKRMKIDVRAFTELVSTLEQRGDLVTETHNQTGGAGRPARQYRLLGGGEGNGGKK